MIKHPDCLNVCQQADGYGVWPEHSCNPVCVWMEAHVAHLRVTEHAPEMLKALQRLTHPAADDDDLAYALEVIAKATGAAA